MPDESRRYGKFTIKLTHLDKVFFPDDGITKGDLVEYYSKISRVMLPYLKNRAVTMHRFPDGISGENFYHKDIPDYFPEWMDRVEVKKEGGTLHQLICSNAASLVYIANQACITVHTWLSRRDKLDIPDMMIFDLDPPEHDFALVQRGALLMRDFLEGELGLNCFAKTTGSKGIHVVVPLKREAPFDDVRTFAHNVANLLCARHPDELTTEQRIEKRGRRLFIDYLRNAYAQTAVAPYSVRARKGAPVATPVSWDEVGKKSLAPNKYTIKNIFKRLESVKDPWDGFSRQAKGLGRARKVLEGLRELGSPHLSPPQAGSRACVG